MCLFYQSFKYNHKYRSLYNPLRVHTMIADKIALMRLAIKLSKYADETRAGTAGAPAADSARALLSGT